MAYTNTKTPIVYYGGKTGMMPHILPMIPAHEVYTEVFFGGGAVFWSKAPSKNETINDKLDLVVNFYRTLRNDFPLLKKEIMATLISRTIHNEATAAVRTHRKHGGTFINSTRHYRVRMAWAFWVCTNFSFSNKIGGGYKYSNHLSVSVPDTLRRRKADFTDLLVARIEKAYIENEDAIHVLNSRNVPHAFHYIDPPYCGADMGHYGGYTWEDYEKLLQWLGTECKGQWLMSNYGSDLLSEYAAQYGWRMQEFNFRLKAPKKAVNSKTEVLISNYTAACGTGDLFKISA